MSEMAEPKLWVLAQLQGGKKQMSVVAQAYEQRVGTGSNVAMAAIGNLVHALIIEGLVKHKADEGGLILELWLSEKGKLAISGGASAR